LVATALIQIRRRYGWLVLLWDDPLRLLSDKFTLECGTEYDSNDEEAPHPLLSSCLPLQTGIETRHTEVPGSNTGSSEAGEGVADDTAACCGNNAGEQGSGSKKPINAVKADSVNEKTYSQDWEQLASNH